MRAYRSQFYDPASRERETVLSTPEFLRAWKPRAGVLRGQDREEIRRAVLFSLRRSKIKDIVHTQHLIMPNHPSVSRPLPDRPPLARGRPGMCGADVQAGRTFRRGDGGPSLPGRSACGGGRHRHHGGEIPSRSRAGQAGMSRNTSGDRFCRLDGLRRPPALAHRVADETPSRVTDACSSSLSLAAGVIAIWAGAWYGGELVYRYGAGSHALTAETIERSASGSNRTRFFVTSRQRPPAVSQTVSIPSTAPRTFSLTGSATGRTDPGPGRRLPPGPAGKSSRGIPTSTMISPDQTRLMNGFTTASATARPLLPRPGRPRGRKVLHADLHASNFPFSWSGWSAERKLVGIADRDRLIGHLPLLHQLLRHDLLGPAAVFPLAGARASRRSARPSLRAWPPSASPGNRNPRT